MNVSRTMNDRTPHKDDGSLDDGWRRTERDGCGPGEREKKPNSITIM